MPNISKLFNCLECWASRRTVSRRSTATGATPPGHRRETIAGNNPFLLYVAVHSGLQGVKAKVPFPQFLLNHGSDNSGGARGWPGAATATPRRVSATPLATPSTGSQRSKVLTAVEKCGTFLAPLVHCRTL